MKHLIKIYIPLNFFLILKFLTFERGCASTFEQKRTLYDKDITEGERNHVSDVASATWSWSSRS